MKRVLWCAALVITVPLAAQSPAVDTSGAGALISQAIDHSQVMENLQYLADAIGPRLSGSAAMRKSNDWTAERFRAYGLTATLEEYPFAVTWDRGSIMVKLTAPYPRQVNAWSWAW